MRTGTWRRLEHYAAIFAAAFAVTLVANAQHIMDAHGLDALKAAAVAAVVASLKAGYDALTAPLRPSPPPARPQPLPRPPGP